MSLTGHFNPEQQTLSPFLP